MADNDAAAESNGEQAGPQVAVHKVYLRDGSVEVPEGAHIFTQNFQPEVNVDLNSKVEELPNENYEVSLTVTVTAKGEDKTAYIVEIQQAGVFQISGFEQDAQRGHVLGAYCPTVLFPYVREAVSDMVQRAGFPPFLLQPVNFDALYQEQMRRAQQQPEPAASQTH